MYNDVSHANEPYNLNLIPKILKFRLLLPPVWVIALVVLAVMGWNYGTPHLRVAYGPAKSVYVGLNGYEETTYKGNIVKLFKFRNERINRLFEKIPFRIERK